MWVEGNHLMELYATISFAAHTYTHEHRFIIITATEGGAALSKPCTAYGDRIRLYKESNLNSAHLYLLGAGWNGYWPPLLKKNFEVNDHIASMPLNLLAK